MNWREREQERMNQEYLARDRRARIATFWYCGTRALGFIAILALIAFIIYTLSGG